MKAIYQIEETYTITGRGIVFTGNVLEGLINPGDLIVFEYKGENLERKIKGITQGHTANGIPIIGILIACNNEVEMEDLGNWHPAGTIAHLLRGTKLLLQPHLLIHLIH